MGPCIACSKHTSHFCLVINDERKWIQGIFEFIIGISIGGLFARNADATSTVDGNALNYISMSAMNLPLLL